jgi:putative membrane protein
MKKLFYLIVFLFVAILAVTINLKNPQVVSFDYYFNIHFDAPLILVLTATFIMGLLLGWLLMSVSVFRNKRQVGKAKRELAKVEMEVENLRTMPIRDEV